jgi:5-(carboxyamino)imidazole ribonucleotide synthase
MVNYIGGLPVTKDVLAIEHAHLHLYGKSPRKGRKVAHVTVRTNTDKEYQEAIKKLSQLAENVDDS